MGLEKIHINILMIVYFTHSDTENIKIALKALTHGRKHAYKYTQMKIHSRSYIYNDLI